MNFNTHANRGQTFESEIELGLRIYEKLGLAHIVRLHVPKVVVHGQMRYTERTMTDYIGWLRGGTAVLLEAKSWKDHKVTWRPDREHQYNSIVQVNKDGGLGLYLLCEHGDRMYVWEPGEEHSFVDPFSEARAVLALLPCIERKLAEAPWDWLSLYRDWQTAQEAKVRT